MRPSAGPADAGCSVCASVEHDSLEELAAGGLATRRSSPKPFAGDRPRRASRRVRFRLHHAEKISATQAGASRRSAPTAGTSACPASTIRRQASSRWRPAASHPRARTPARTSVRALWRGSELVPAERVAVTRRRADCALAMPVSSCAQSLRSTRCATLPPGWILRLRFAPRRMTDCVVAKPVSSCAKSRDPRVARRFLRGGSCDCASLRAA